MKRLYDRLKEYSLSDMYGFHMPGHKRNNRIMGIDLPYELDITEIEGFDDLHHADGILKEAHERAAKVFGADETHFLVNGSTVGILSAILGSTEKKDKILIARHCHKSVFHAVYMNELIPEYVYPEYDPTGQMNAEIRPEDVKRALDENKDIKVVVLVSPNYDGVVSDIGKIAQIVHEHDAVLIVDEAHGAHFGFHPYFPERANSLGADVVINSLHKTLPSLTQTALLHLNGSRVNREKIRRYLGILQTSSPSYIFMASLDACVDLIEREGDRLFEDYAVHLRKIREDLKELKHLKLLETENFDPSKLVISVADTDMKSMELYKILLRDYHLQMEMVAGTYVLAMTSPADTEEGYDRLKKALVEIDARAGEGRARGRKLPGMERVLTPGEALAKKEAGDLEVIPWKEAQGRVSLEFAYLYPPGSPVIVPGEIVSEEAVKLLTYYEEQDFQIEGLCAKGKIKVWKNG